MTIAMSKGIFSSGTKENPECATVCECHAVFSTGREECPACHRKTDPRDNLKAARLRLSLTVREVSAATGIPGTVISQVENGRVKSPGVPVLLKLSAIYGVPLRVMLLWYFPEIMGKI
jgi:hypothetical protein